MEGVREGRHHHVGDPADRLPLSGSGQPRVRTPRLPARGGLLLVHLLTHAGAVPLRPRRPLGPVPCRPRPAPRSGRCLGGSRRRPGVSCDLPACSGQGWLGPRLVGRGQRDHRCCSCAHDQEVRTRPRLRVLAHPRHVHGVSRRRQSVRVIARRLDAVVLRLVLRPARRIAAGVRRPDRRSRVGGLVERLVPDHVGRQCAPDAYPGRPLHGRGPLPGTEGRDGVPRLRGQHQVRRRVAVAPPRNGRRPGNGDGTRHPQGVLHRAAGAAFRRLRQDVQRPAVPGVAAREGWRLGAG